MTGYHHKLRMPSHLDFSSLKADYHNPAYTVPDICKNHHIGSQRLKRIADKHGWLRPKRHLVREIRREFQPSAESQKEAELESIADSADIITEKHKLELQEWRKIVRDLRQKLERSTLGVKKRSEVIKDMAKAITALMDLERRVYGMEKSLPYEKPFILEINIGNKNVQVTQDGNGRGTHLEYDPVETARKYAAYKV